MTEPMTPQECAEESRLCADPETAPTETVCVLWQIAAQLAGIREALERLPQPRTDEHLANIADLILEQRNMKR